ncbi:hypothetical protein K469DRAFT_579978 [Zopfia rhizophila CBS 207.26]|uniref:superoxide dismutase n=1 Tax=Zopfia rhizophila CBS 207.26 TaxID=1314779 RepID=A0A6A6DY41_9PEZI|nr:hypothetical protein K469DRAFT_579978 [Zopfia rhizophila CBS 207.26]
MRTLSALVALSTATLLTAQTTGKLGDAIELMNNPPGASYVAMFPNTTNNDVRGKVIAVSDATGTGVNFHIMIMGLPLSGGPFMNLHADNLTLGYHLHDQPVPAGGNCSGTLAHLGPFQRGQTPPCDMTMPQTCEVGDLSGKHGRINGTKVSKSFLDLYAALVPGNGAFFGNRSIVIHYANSTRLACANFNMMSSGSTCNDGMRS